MRYSAILFCLVSLSAVAQGPSGASAQASQAGGLQAVTVPPLKDIKGVVSWDTLAKVDRRSEKNSIVPVFTKEILALNDQQVKLQGFMMPLDPGRTQKHFLISVNSATCPYCLPAGPEGVVEVLSSTPIKYGFEPIVISGKLAVLKNDPTGLYYKMTNAEIASAN